jgi:hypothetical protein
MEYINGGVIKLLLSLLLRMIIFPLLVQTYIDGPCEKMEINSSVLWNFIYASRKLGTVLLRISTFER